MPELQPSRDPESLATQVRDRVLVTIERLAMHAPDAPRRAGDAFAPDREALALRRVFREMGLAQRKRRQQLGRAPSAEVRLAAEAFRRDPTLDTLVGVAGALQTAGLLA